MSGALDVHDRTMWDSPSARTWRYVVLDVFTDTPLEGNQLAVFDDGERVRDGVMQRAARELNLSETVFLLPSESGGDVRIRIFTPAGELPFAGHPVLGSAFAVAASRDAAEVVIETGVGPVRVSVDFEGGLPTFGWMEQPVPRWASFEHADELLSCLGVERSLLPVEVYENGPRHVFVQLESREAVASLRPDLRALSEFEIAANCFAGSGGKWKTRMFAPSHGVAEDPATGSAAGPLAVHLARHGRIPFGDEIEIRQGAEIGRPSVLYASAHGQGDEVERVKVGGRAVFVARGEYRLE